MKLEKYLRRQNDFYALAPLPSRLYRQAVVIPVRAEWESLPATLAALARLSGPERDETLVILSINNPPPEEDDYESAGENQMLLGALAEGDRRFSPDGLNICRIDAAGPGRELPKGGGVGRARKIGMDLALTILDWDRSPLLFSLDADTITSSDYIAASRTFLETRPNVPGAAIAFAHRTGQTPEQDQAMTLYELFLRYYVMGLRLACSPYAYHAIGSAMVFRAEAYVAAGGMKTHRGGEDFYFLQELRKLGPIGQITAASVHPSARVSARVPFGTGPRLREIMSVGDMPAYHPETFKRLEELLNAASVWLSENPNSADSLFRALSPVTAAFLTSRGFSEAWESVFRHTREDQLKQAFHRWFDAFETLKLVHFLETTAPNHYPRLNAMTAYAELFRLFGKDPITAKTPETLLATIREMERNVSLCPEW